MSIEIKMPALSPTMEEGKLAKWLVKEGDKVAAGDILAEIETDKATMEFEAIDEGTVTSLAVAEGAEGVKVGTVIATISAEGEAAPAKPAAVPAAAPAPAATAPVAAAPSPAAPVAAATPAASGTRVFASPLARRLAAEKSIDLGGVTGTGAGGRIVRADIDALAGGSAAPAAPAPVVAVAASAAPAPVAIPDFGIPYEAEKLNNVRKTIARRLTEAKQTIPHIYLTLDVRLDALLKLRGERTRRWRPKGSSFRSTIW